MAGGIISKKHLDQVNARLDQLEASNHAMATVIVDQQQTIAEHQRLIDTLALCLAAELGISKERGLEYRRRAMEERRLEAQQQAPAVDTAHLDAKRAVPVGEANPQADESNTGADETAKADAA